MKRPQDSVNPVAYFTAAGGFTVAATIWCVSAIALSRGSMLSFAAINLAVGVMFLTLGCQARAEQRTGW